MTRLIILLCSVFMFGSCGNTEEKPKTTISKKQQPVQSAADLTLQDWLKGKIWSADDGSAPMALLQLKSDGGYELKSGKNPGTWKILNGELSLSFLTEWPIEKTDDSSFRLYVKPTDKWHTYKFTSNTD